MQLYARNITTFIYIATYKQIHSNITEGMANVLKFRSSSTFSLCKCERACSCFCHVFFLVLCSERRINTKYFIGVCAPKKSFSVTKFEKFVKKSFACSKEKLCSAADYLTSQPSSLNAIVFYHPKKMSFNLKIIFLTAADPI